MGWETRRRGGSYYTRSHRSGGRVVREYVGGGLIGELAAQTDALKREQRQLDTLAWRAERERLDAIERDLAAYCAAVGELACEHLSVAGYHQHARGEWRRKRMAKTTASKAQPPAKIPAQPVGPVDDLAQLQRRIDALMTPAQKGDRKAMDTLRPALRAAYGAQWETRLTSPADAAREGLLEATMGDNLLIREAWARRAQTLQRDLEGPAPTPLERILCERVALCWLDAQLADIAFGSASRAGTSFKAGEYYGKRAERAQRRYLDATLALARVRRLLAPVIAQVNIAQPGAKQLNIAQPDSATRAAVASRVGPVEDALAALGGAAPVTPDAPVAVVTAPTWPPAHSQ